MLKICAAITTVIFYFNWFHVTSDITLQLSCPRLTLKYLEMKYHHFFIVYVYYYLLQSSF
jgi:hypothetical protein